MENYSRDSKPLEAIRFDDTSKPKYNNLKQSNNANLRAINDRNHIIQKNKKQERGLLIIGISSINLHIKAMAI